ncbi:uncharacterized protein RCO7_07896 [Rhynchosporium graminicola]|uniref:Chitin-binding type-1 domain-containing protein n=1 Tax=Rhynchosporium graminicola TaxID=2792576 RepID=A0A1E1KNH4_9HELO|nr:uncharacterized protein RCO7_07896 [Rhynchosporium commune]
MDCSSKATLRAYVVLCLTQANNAIHTFIEEVESSASLSSLKNALCSSDDLSSAMQFLIATIIFFSLIFGHIEVESPGPFRGRSNPNTKSVDYDGTNPLTGAGQFPCKGYHIAAMADPTGEGKPTALWRQGAPAAIKLTKGGLHSGGSCQASLSYDGKIFTVIYSMQGNCPTSDMAFTVPADAPVGPVIGSWSWFNKSGNREMYQNCFSAIIEAATGTVPPAIPFSQRPPMLVANLGGTCKTADMVDVRFPNPGPDVTGTGDDNSLIGDCGAAAPVTPVAPSPRPADHEAPEGLEPFETPAKSELVPFTSKPTRSVPPLASQLSVSFSFSSIPIPVDDQVPGNLPAPTRSPTSAVIVPVVPTPSPTSTSAVAVPVVPGKSTPVPSSAAPKPTGGAPSGGISTDGSCGGTKGKTCASPNCCSQRGWCGTSAGHCGTGCQAQFGVCLGGRAKFRRHTSEVSR